MLCTGANVPVMLRDWMENRSISSRSIAFSGRSMIISVCKHIVGHVFTVFTALKHLELCIQPLRLFVGIGKFLGHN